ncbi:MAG: hypothetical protein ABIK96_00190 [bacterium]|nr:hypothetical protein [bacterium]
MHQLVQSIALMAALAAVCAGLWQDWALLTTLKKALLAYLGIFGLSGVMVLAIRLVPILEKPEPPLETAARSGPKDR